MQISGNETLSGRGRQHNYQYCEVDMGIKKLTLLHANDIHGQLNFKVGEDFKINGGISLLSGYLKRERSKGPVFFGICGDVLQEDVLGSDYKGSNTMELINYLDPDAISLGNHELDYGLAHLLIFKECIKSPTLCANIFVSKVGQPLFTPSIVREIDGVKILLIGVIPEAFFGKIISDEFCRKTLSYVDSYEMIRHEIAVHENDNIDMVVLMSHYGIEGDRLLAEHMPEDIHVDLLLGGHTHIDMDEPEVINGIPVVQSSYGTTHIGRYDIEFDTDEKKIKSWKWERVSLNEDTSDFDTGVDELADKVTFFKKVKKAAVPMFSFADNYKHESRLYETDLSNIVTDAFADIYPVDFIIMQSGSLRRKECGPVVTKKDFTELYPFDDAFCAVSFTGAEIKDAFNYLFSLKPDGSVMNGTFDYSRGFRLKVDADDCWNKGCKIEELTLYGKPFEDGKIYRVGMTKNCVKNCGKYFGISVPEEKVRVVSYSTQGDLATWFLKQEEPVKAPVIGERFTIKNLEM